MTPIVLASTSIYRKQLLQKLKINFICAAPDIDETPLANEPANQLALRLAKEKALAIQLQYPQHIIIASDQVASFADQILGKPGDYKQTVQQLKHQSGQTVNFFTSVCVLNSSTNICHIDLDVCTVYFKQLSERQILNYVALEKPYNCAGGFKSEGLGISLFEKIEGEDPNALIGLPLIKLISLLQKLDIEIL